MAHMFLSHRIHHVWSTLNLDHYREQHLDGQRDLACVRARVMVKQKGSQTSPPQIGHGWGNASPLEFLSE